jgi:hypothetical protein
MEGKKLPNEPLTAGASAPIRQTSKLKDNDDLSYSQSRVLLRALLLD